ncbi:hypothetical protein BLSMQ_2932 [Brevibacterium aurantiacum]|uniref:Uncharacterized protein n=1 Tax=Brevibacterium aurantiacum TaxID=273384 RepID=A0A1D7W7L7_BREAU|nr:hypothetical protein BLSMQ_2932 [Brevibacterium aurantiacum]
MWNCQLLRELGSCDISPSLAATAGGYCWQPTLAAMTSSHEEEDWV